MISIGKTKGYGKVIRKIIIVNNLHKSSNPSCSSICWALSKNIL